MVSYLYEITQVRQPRKHEEYSEARPGKGWNSVDHLLTSCSLPAFFLVINLDIIIDVNYIYASQKIRNSMHAFLS